MHGHVRRTAVQCVSVLTAAGYLLAPAGMTRDCKVPALVQAWLSMPGNTDKRCAGVERKTLVAQLIYLQPEKTEKQAETPTGTTT
jgi:hypothetical protein